jgi:hypothetical protein
VVPFLPEKDFPEPKDLAEWKERKANHASNVFAENPDGVVLLPPLKEKFKKDWNWWRINVHYPWTGQPVLKEKEGVAYHFLGTAYRLIGTMKYKLDWKRANQLLWAAIFRGEKSLEKEAKKWEGTIYEKEAKEDSQVRLMKIDEIEKNLGKTKEDLIDMAKYHGIPENHAEALADLLPVFIDASKAFANIVNRVALSLIHI